MEVFHALTKRARPPPIRRRRAGSAKRSFRRQAPLPSAVALRPSLLEKIAEKVPETIHGGAVVVRPVRRRRRWRLVLLLLALCAGAGGGYYWWSLRQFHLPPGFAYGNGRLEADPIDIDTKFAARIAEIRVEEGDRVTAGQVVARMDTRDLQASLGSLIAQKAQAEHSLEEARALVVQQNTQVVLAQQEIDRTKTSRCQGVRHARAA